ncbi:MAG: wax ester/triacylglycerol synthase family O-acyltransferase, partial [Acidimicrobiia bacterium]|nr:wax ester/triacylglycerol synthase family O-acyltransferase [Acidimicrobiia bacterium]
MRQMSGQDAAFLYGETPNWHMHVSALMVLDPSTCPDGWSFARFKELLVERMPEAPQLRWKLRDVPFGLDRPYWIEDPDVDPDFHIRRIGVPSPGGPQELADLCGHLAGLKLDRSRPLWEAWVIEGLPEGRVAP